MAIAAGRIRAFGESRQSFGQHRVPGLQHRDILVAQARGLHRPQQIEPEILRALGQSRFRVDPRDERPGLLPGHAARQHGQHVGMLTERLPLGRVGEQAPGFIPAMLLGRRPQALRQVAVMGRRRPAGQTRRTAPPRGPVNKPIAG